MQQVIETSGVVNSFEQLSKLYHKEERQFIEWSIKVNPSGLTPRFKPTLYLYPGKKSDTYQQLNEQLYALTCPEEVIVIQKNASYTSMYQGIRIPNDPHDQKCLFIHQEGHTYIHCYKWHNEVHFERYYYQYRDKAKLSDVNSLIHRQLEPFLGAIISKPQFNWQSGIWTQEFEEQTREIYLSFPYRTNVGWIIRSFEKHLPQDAYLESLKNSNLQFRNIGFDTDVRNAYPSITIYFTMPLTEHFPGNDAELVSMTSDFFGYD